MTLLKIAAIAVLLSSHLAYAFSVTDAMNSALDEYDASSARRAEHDAEFSRSLRSQQNEYEAESRRQGALEDAESAAFVRERNARIPGHF